MSGEYRQGINNNSAHAPAWNLELHGRRVAYDKAREGPAHTPEI